MEFHEKGNPFCKKQEIFQLIPVLRHRREIHCQKIGLLITYMATFSLEFLSNETQKVSVSSSARDNYLPVHLCFPKIALEMGKNMSYPVHCRGQQYCCCPPKSVWATKHISLLCIVGHFVAECSSIWQLYRNSLAIILSCSIIFFVVQIPCRLPYRPLLAKLVSPLRIPPLSWANIG